MDKPFFERAQKCLSESEKQLLLSFQKVVRKEQYLAGHYCLRLGLTQLLGQPENYWDIDHQAGAAPVLLNPLGGHNVSLSISHSKDQVICSVSLNNSIGIDLECHIRERPFIEFSEQYLSLTELNKLKALKGEQLKEYFYSLWTVMESVAKARGKGLGQDIFDGAWATDLNAIQQPTNADNTFYTYTAKLDNFTITIASESALEAPLNVLSYKNNGLHRQKLDFDQGYFFLNGN